MRQAARAATLVAVMFGLLFCFPLPRVAAMADAPPATAPSQFTFNFKEAPLDTVLDYFSQTLGFEILKDGPIDVRVTIMSRQPVTSDQAVTMLTAALRANGYVAVRDGRLLHISTRDKAKKGNIPVHFGNDPADVPETDELITQVIPIENVSASKLRDDLKPLIGGDTDVTANEESNSIVVTDTSANIHRLVLIISEMDKLQAATADMRIIQLKYASAAATAKLIESLFKPSGSGQGQQQPMMMRGMPQPPPNPSQPPEAQRHELSLVVAADDRTNTLIVMAPEPTLKLVDGIVARLDTDHVNPAPPVYMRLYTLRYAAADATAKLINNLFKPPQNNNLLELLYGFEPSEQQSKINVVAEADDRTNTVVVTGPPDRFPDVEALIQKLDASPSVEQDMRIIHLRFADAAVVAKLIEDMFEPKKEEENASPIRLILIGSGSQEQQLSASKLSVSFDERTNIVIVSGPTAVLGTVQRVIEALDADPTSVDSMFIYHLRNAQAQHLSYTLNVLFGNISNASQGNQQNPQNAQLAALQNQFQNNRPAENNTSGNLPGISPRGNRSPQPNAAPNNPVINELTGNVFVVAEPDSNSLLVTTETKYERQVRQIIDDLDAPVRQVLIKVLVAEVTLDNGLQYGVDFSVLNERQSSNDLFLTGQTTTVQPAGTVTTGGQTTTTSGGTTVTSTYTAPVNSYNQTAGNNYNGSNLASNLGTAAAAAATPGGLVYTLLEHNVTATIQALQSEGKLDVLSRPYILTSDNQEATIVIGEEDPFISDTRVETTGQLVNTIQYQQIGVILDVTPHVNPDGLVVMDVNPQVSQKEPGGVTITQGVVSPVFSTRTATAHVSVPDGSTIVIGGMMQDQLTTTVNKIPILGDIPVLGVLFQNTNTQKAKTELLFFLTPHVAPLPARLEAISRAEQRGATLTTQAVGPGVFDDYMQAMQRGGSPDTEPAEPSSPVKIIRLDGLPDDNPPK
ncbi:MAG TPA: secretin N-terminal domain-containing protein [Tepidisphaeraceae bacterium]|nr:secretin N-terminal domain-containing protein [Tepidisphaeraceae bacterium]